MVLRSVCGGVVLADIWRWLVSAILVLLIILAVIFLPGTSWEGGTFVRGMVLLPFLTFGKVVGLALSVSG